MPNPMLNEKAFERAAGVGTLPPPDPRTSALAAEAALVTQAPPTTGPVVGTGTGFMTMGGAVTATGVLLALLLVTGVIGWNLVDVRTDELGTTVVNFPGWLFIPMLGAFVVAIVAAFKPRLAPVLAPVYALGYGLVVGAISALYEAEWSGIVLQAVGATVAVFAVTLVLYALRLVRVTNRFRMIVVAATAGLALFYLVSILFSLFGATPSFINQPTGLGIAFSVFAAGLAAFNLFLDFDLIERGARAGAPKHMEWYGALGLTITLVWLYLEMLRLLAKLRER